MTNRIVVSLVEEARTRTAALADRIARERDCRVGFVMPSHGMLVCEVGDEAGVDRIRGMAEVRAIRVQAVVEGRRRKMH